MPVPVVVTVEDDLRRNRLTVAFRLPLTVPHLVLLVPLSLAAAVATVAGWFAALALGRLPDRIAGFLGATPGYAARVSGYLMFLTDRYPPFAWHDTAHPVRVRLPAAGPLNRWAVLFRPVLTVPVAVVQALVAAGWCVSSVVIWLTVLATGRIPRPAFLATLAALRYAMRYDAYTTLRVPTYPWGLFGDQAAATDDDSPGAGRHGAPLRLGPAASALLAGFLLLGAAAEAVAVAVPSSTGAGTSRSTLLDALDAAHATLGRSIDRFQSEAKTCRSAPEQLPCIQAADARLASAFRDFDSRTFPLDYPDSAVAPAQHLDDVTVQLADALDQLSSAGSATAYATISRQRQVAALGDRFDQAYDTLVATLRGTG